MSARPTSRLPRVVEDDAEGEAPARADAAHPVAEIDAVEAARAAHGAVMHREDHRLALRERHHLGARLHARPLLDEEELAAGELRAGCAQKQGELQGEDQGAVEVLVQAVVVPGPVFEEKRRRLGLPGGVAFGEIGRETRRKAPLLAQGRAPAIGDGREARIERAAQGFDGAWQGIAQIFVLAAAEAVALHHHTAAETIFGLVESGELATYLRVEKRRERGVAAGVESARDGVPVDLG